jgi:hypothetical protein
LQQNQLAYTSERTLSKKSLYNDNSNPTARAVNVSLYLKKNSFITGVADTGVNLFEFEMAPMVYSGARAKLIRKKTRS